MTPSDVEHTSTTVRSRQELIRQRRRRQTYTFVTVFTLVSLVGLVALGNWRQWWTIGGSAQAATICPTQTYTAPELTNVSVYNATDRKGLAAAVSKELQKRQFRVLSIATEHPEEPITTVVEIRYGPTGKLAARTVALQFPAKIRMIEDKRADESVDVVIGEKYKAMIAAKKGLAAIKLKEDPRGCIQATAPPTPEPSAS